MSGTDPGRAVSCFFVTDLHGHRGRYRRLFETIRRETPLAVFLGGDLLPSAFRAGPSADESQEAFVEEVLAPGFDGVRDALGSSTPRVFLIPGNDDCGSVEPWLLRLGEGRWEYVHGARRSLERFSVFGYAFVPPTPFRLKDWERFDVSRFTDPGCTAPDEGLHTVPVEEADLKWRTIEQDLAALAGEGDLSSAIFLFHAPPYDTDLDRAALDGKRIDHVPLDVHVGSIAIRRFIQRRQPWLTLHGHVHESARLTGAWRTTIGATHCLSAAHDGSELALVRFDALRPVGATRELLPCE
jgi:Icc-related predicted phosphoesterase